MASTNNSKKACVDHVTTGFRQPAQKRQREPDHEEPVFKEMKLFVPDATPIGVVLPDEPALSPDLLKWKAEYFKSCQKYELSPLEFGTTFKIFETKFWGRVFKIVGINTRNSKNPIMAQDVTNKQLLRMSGKQARQNLDWAKK